MISSEFSFFRRYFCDLFGILFHCIRLFRKRGSILIRSVFRTHVFSGFFRFLAVDFLRSILLRGVILLGIGQGFLKICSRGLCVIGLLP